MTERWKGGLDELSRVPMSEGLLERARAGSRMPDPPGPSGARRAVTIVVALGVFAVASFGAWDALRPSPAPVHPAGGEEMSQRVYGDTTCVFRSSPAGKLDAAAGSASTSDPVAACQALWATALGNAPAPDMIACVDPASPGHVSVTEVSSSTDETCAGLGDSTLPNGWDANLDEWHAVENAAESVFPQIGNGISCQRDENTAVDAWRNALDDHGFMSWKVTVDDNNASWPCFNYKENYDTMEITIVHDTVS
jgi:hypothetical protein